MPLPLIPIAIGVVAAVTALGVGIPLGLKTFRKKAKGKSIPILGRQEVGKTTLLHFLVRGKLPDKRVRTPDPLPGGTFSLDLDRKSEVEFTIPKDLPGHTEPAYKDWKDGFESSGFVWYLFRSDLLVAGDAAETALVQEHLDHFVDWYRGLREREAADRKGVV